MAKKKKRKIQFRKPYHTIVVDPFKEYIGAIENYPGKNLPAYKPKPTLHAGGGLAQRGLGKAFMKGGKV